MIHEEMFEAHAWSKEYFKDIVPKAAVYFVLCTLERKINNGTLYLYYKKNMCWLELIIQTQAQKMVKKINKIIYMWGNPIRIY